MIFGYARVSSDGQSLDAQIEELTREGATKIFSEKISGATTKRRQLVRAIRALDRGDVLMVTRLDRLARSTQDLLNVLDVVGKQGATFRSLRDAWADDHGTWKVDGDDLGGAGRVRARVDPNSDIRRSRASDRAGQGV